MMNFVGDVLIFHQDERWSCSFQIQFSIFHHKLSRPEVLNNNALHSPKRNNYLSDVLHYNTLFSLHAKTLLYEGGGDDRYFFNMWNSYEVVGSSLHHCQIKYPH